MKNSLIILATTFVLSAVSCCYAQGSSLQETTNFLHTKIEWSRASGVREITGPEGCTGVHERKIWFSQFEVSGCSVSLTEQIKDFFSPTSPNCYARTPKKDQQQQINFSFKQLAIDSLHVSEWDGNGATIKKPFFYIELPFPEPVTETIDGETDDTKGWSIEVQDKELAERLLKAFKHAAQLCGAKKEAF